MTPTPDPPATLCEAFQWTVAARPQEPALLTLAGTALTWAQYAERVASVAAALRHLGVRRGEPVALMLTNRPEFHVADCAALHLGAVPFSLYNSLPADQIHDLLANTAARLVVTERRFLPVLHAAAAGTSVRYLVTVDQVDQTPEEGVLTLEEAEARAPRPFELAAALDCVGPDDLVTLIHTSGTTGRPKAVEITHRAMLSQLSGSQQVLKVTDQDSHISFLPAAHIADRWGSHYTNLLCGTRLTCLDDITRLSEALALVRPTLFGAVPSVWQRMRTTLERALAEADPGLRALAEEALATGRRHAPRRWKGVLTQAERKELDGADAVLAELRRRVGLDRARVCITGAAPAPEGLQEFFHALGLPLTDAWGMSELSGIALIAPPGMPRPGTVGRPVPGAEIRIADDGELLVRAPFLMRGYRGESELTARTIDAAGWLHTGDLAAVDAQGDIRIIDRKKDLIINTGGQNMAPARIEGVLRESTPLIAHAVVIGDGRPYNVALLVPDREAVTAWARRTGIATAAPWDTRGAELAAAFAGAVADANARLSRAERIRVHEVIADEWAPGGPELTVTLKVRRAAVTGRYADLVETLYRRGAADR
ncbi:AMP-binding protein [Streptomyces sp. G-G2]|uniref:AMP-dependent synthetase/ligase n=1 Tax=Streptomyces sp. G-G2 TaxID=3046201 RepID=UPI0024B9BF29|nr:AMP-binding protein [Streptomyces sp. G-G2]MDJ0382201.1 AMP-binding protein [Streptomyces sp. G-G2]